MFYLFQIISWFTPKYFCVILSSKCCMEYPFPSATSYKKLSFPEERERYHTHTHTHTHDEILLSHKNWNNAICNNMDGPRDDHTKWSQPEKTNISRDCLYLMKSYCVILLRNLKKFYKWTYLQNRSRLTDIKNKHDYQRGKGERDKLGI